MAAETWPASVALSTYALGYVDTVQAMAPLPQYLAAVYGGGLVLGTATAPALNGAETPESLVDRFAPAYPDWEPDALYRRAHRQVRIFFAVPRSAWVDLNLRRSLEDMGHELVRFDFPGWPDEADAHWQRVGKPRTNERLLSKFRAALRQGRVDLFYGYFYSSVVYPETIDLIRQSGVPTVNFSCNNVHQFDLVRDIAPHFDVCVVPELAAIADFKAVGAVPVRIQLAANPSVYRPYPEPRMYDVTFVGQRYADRADFLDHLFRHGIDVRAWGAGWQTHKRLDVAHARAALALIEDERLDGIRRLIRHRLSSAHAQTQASAQPESRHVMLWRPAAAAKGSGEELFPEPTQPGLRHRPESRT